MSQLKDTELQGLHAMVAQVLSAQVGQKVKFTNDETGVEEEQFIAAPATIAAAIKFLKDNHITCSIEEDDNLGKIDELLKNKELKGRAKLAAVSPIKEANS